MLTDELLSAEAAEAAVEKDDADDNVDTDEIGVDEIGAAGVELAPPPQALNTTADAITYT